MNRLNRIKRQKQSWHTVERCLIFYKNKYSPSAWPFFRYREGYWLLIRLILSFMFFVIADNQFTCWNITFVILGGLLFLDIFLANISIAFVAVTRAPINDLRSFFLTFTAFINIVVIYALFYKFLDQFNYAMCNPQLLYFSFVTITTLGYGDFVPQRSGTMSQIVVIMELLTGLIFIAGVFARIINTGRRTNK